MDEASNRPAPEAEATRSPLPRLTSRQRRVLGVLVEKAKTTPESYPLTLNSLTSGCNQKSNRSPQMNLSPDDVESELERLRELGAVTEVQGGGRVPKYRHRIYEWLQLDKVEAAIVTELLLRGEQTVGELRGRAARMEPIADVNALMPILNRLIERGVVIALTPEGRGQVVTHGLMSADELQRLRDTVASGPLPTRSATGGGGTNASAGEELELLRAEITEMRELLADLSQRVTELEAR